MFLFFTFHFFDLASIVFSGLTFFFKVFNCIRFKQQNYLGLGKDHGVGSTNKSTLTFGFT